MASPHKLTQNICLLLLGVCLLVMIGWYAGWLTVLQIIPSGPTMKFNTALGLALLSAAIWLKSQKEQISKWYPVPAYLAILLGLINLSNYYYAFFPAIDNLFVQDNFSQIYPGRMSPATAFCMLSLGIATLIPLQGSSLRRNLATALTILVFLIGMISVFSMILQVPSKDRIFAFQTMALHTSIAYVVLALCLSKLMSDTGYFSLFYGKFAGSKLLRQSLMLIGIVSLSLSFILMYLTENGHLASDFGIAVHGAVFIFICALGLNVIGVKIIKQEQEREHLKHDLEQANLSLANFRNAVDESSILAITDAKGIITYVNQNFETISGYSAKELLGQTHRIVNSQYHDKAFFQDMWNRISSGKSWRGEIRNQRKDGSYYWVHSTIFPLFHENGEIAEYISIRQDITAKKEAEISRNTSYVSELEQKNQELEQFAFIASHDLQEPVGTLIGFVNILEEQKEIELSEESSLYLNYIRSSSHRLQMLIKGLMDFANIGIGQELKRVSNNKILAKILEEKKRKIEAARALITFEPLPDVIAYPAELENVWRQLISNAIKFAQEGQNPKIQISFVEEEDQWVFSVVDNGIGMDDKHLEKVFLIFRRLQAHDQIPGIGVGLAYCRKAIELHKGKIWLESKPSKGTVVYFSLPKLDQND